MSFKVKSSVDYSKSIEFGQSFDADGELAVFCICEYEDLMIYLTKNDTQDIINHLQSVLDND